MLSDRQQQTLSLDYPTLELMGSQFDYTIQYKFTNSFAIIILIRGRGVGMDDMMGSVVFQSVITALQQQQQHAVPDNMYTSYSLYIGYSPSSSLVPPTTPTDDIIIDMLLDILPSIVAIRMIFINNRSSEAEAFTYITSIALQEQWYYIYSDL